MIKKLISAGIFLLAFSQGSNAAIVEGDGFVSSGLRISSITGAVNDLSLIGATQISQQIDFVIATGSFTNNLSPVQPFGAIGIGDILETTIDVDTQVDGPVGGVFSTVTMSALLAVTNVSSTAQSFVLDVFSNMDVNASDGFGAAQASGFSGFELMFARSLVDDFSNFLPVASDDIFSSSQGGIGPVAFQLLFEDSFTFDIASGEQIRFALASSVTAGAQSPVPLPATVWLFGTALVGLLGFRKQKNQPNYRRCI